MNNDNAPTFREDERLYRQGYLLVAGLDEAGRGALAGPVVAAAVILPPDLQAAWLERVRDSKQLDAARREELYGCIMATAVAWGVGTASHKVIARINILGATRVAMGRAVATLAVPPDYLLIDHIKLPDISLPQRGITRGDSSCLSIACAAIVAKVTRDRIMARLEAIFPGYGLSRHKGYGTRRHLGALQELGPSRLHRRSFRPVAELGLPRLL